MGLEPHIARMRAYADAAREHPTWSVAYAEDVPLLLAEIERLRSTDDRSHRMRKAESDLRDSAAEVARLRAWLDRIGTSVAQALAGEKP